VVLPEGKVFEKIPVALNNEKNVFIYKNDGYDYKNIIPNPSFEEGLWNEKVGDCHNYDNNPIIAMNLNQQDKSDGAQSLQLEATRHIACSSINLPVKSGRNYILSFEYQSPNAAYMSYYIGFNDDNKTAIKENVLIDNTGWNKFTRNIIIPGGATQMSLYVYAKPVNETENIINRYDNFQLIENPNLTNAYYLLSEPKTELKNPASVKFDLVNPTKKLVHIKGATTAFFLAMSESYHPQWQLQMNNKKVQGFLDKWWPWAKPDRVGDEYHYKLNDFLNTWYVDPVLLCETKNINQKAKDGCVKNANGSYDMEMVIEFWPQRWFYLGLIISSLTLLGCLFYLYWTTRRKIARLILSIINGLRRIPDLLKNLSNQLSKGAKFVISGGLIKSIKPMMAPIKRIYQKIKAGLTERAKNKTVLRSAARISMRKENKDKLALERERLALEREKLSLEKDKFTDSKKYKFPEAEINKIQRPAKPEDWESTATDANAADIDLDLVKSKKEEIGQRLNKKFKDEADMLYGLGCLTAAGAPTAAGLLLFGKDPQKYFRNSYLTFIKYDDNHDLEKNINFKGNLIKIIEESYHEIKGHVPLKDVISKDTVKRQKVPRFPLVAVRELLINTIAHRDYTIGGSRIIVSMYKDRMEFQSPGGLPNGITPEIILRSQYSRNPIISEALFGLGYMEQLGSGLDRTFQIFADLDRTTPKIESFENMVVVTIYK